MKLRTRSHVERTLKSSFRLLALLGAKLKVIIDGVVEALLHFFNRRAFKHNCIPNAGNHSG